MKKFHAATVYRRVQDENGSCFDNIRREKEVDYCRRLINNTATLYKECFNSKATSTGRLKKAFEGRNARFALR